MALSAEEREIMHDYDVANHYAIKYIVPFLVQLNMRGNMIMEATQTFAKFLTLPESDSTLSLIWDIAFSSLSVLVPALGIAKKLEESAKAVEIAAALGDRRAQALKLMREGGEVAEKVNKGKETVTSIAEKSEKLREQPEGMTELNKLDSSKGPIRDLLKDANKAVALWDKVLDLLDQEKEIRLSDTKAPAGESMTKLAERLLPRIEPLTGDDLDQIELTYLWLMLRDYAKKNVQVVRANDGYHVDTSVSGFNGNQQDTLIEMFGFSARRGKYFCQPPAVNIYVLLAIWGVPNQNLRVRGPSKGWAAI
jgi:hypothetical protein